MLLYSMVVLWPLLIKYIYNRWDITAGEKTISKNWFMVIAILPMMFLIAFRGVSLGADTGQYLNNFIAIRDGVFESVLANSRMEEGYLYFVKGVTYLTQSPKVFQVVYTSIYTIAIVILMQEFEDNCFDFLFFFGTLGLYMFMFTGVRQCLAMSMCIIAYRFAVRRKLIWFIIFVFIAYNLHSSAALFLVVYFVIRLKLKWYNILFYIIGALLATLYIEQIQNFFNDAWDLSYGVEKTGNGGIFFAYLLFLVVLSGFLLYQSNNIEKNKFLMNLSIITVVFWALRLVTRVAERPSYYFMFFVCALVPYAINSVKSKDWTMYQLLIYGTAFLLFIYRLNTNFASLTPYQTFWG